MSLDRPRGTPPSIVRPDRAGACRATRRGLGGRGAQRDSVAAVRSGTRWPRCAAGLGGRGARRGLGDRGARRGLGRRDARRGLGGRDARRGLGGRGARRGLGDRGARRDSVAAVRGVGSASAVRGVGSVVAVRGEGPGRHGTRRGPRVSCAAGPGHRGARRAPVIRARAADRLEPSRGRSPRAVARPIAAKPCGSPSRLPSPGGVARVPPRRAAWHGPRPPP